MGVQMNSEACTRMQKVLVEGGNYFRNGIIATVEIVKSDDEWSMMSEMNAALDDNIQQIAEKSSSGFLDVSEPVEKSMSTRSGGSNIQVTSPEGSPKVAEDLLRPSSALTVEALKLHDLMDVTTSEREPGMDGTTAGPTANHDELDWDTPPDDENTRMFGNGYD